MVVIKLKPMAKFISGSSVCHIKMKDGRMEEWNWYMMWFGRWNSAALAILMH